MLKIDRVELFPITIPRHTGIKNYHIIVRLEAGTGVVGWGEMSDLSHVPMYQFDVPQLEHILNEILCGRDARNVAAIEDVLIRFYPDEGHMYSRSGSIRQGVDLALYDLLGRVDDRPVSTMLGGQLREKIKVCYPVFRMRSVDEVDARLDQVQQATEDGFDLIRVYVGANLQADELFFRRFAERFGSHVAIKSLDFSNLLGWRRALQATRCFADIVDFMLVESPAFRDDLDGLAMFRRSSLRPASEHVQHIRHGWQLLHHNCVDILNISPYLLGGFRASLRLAALAEAAGASVLIGTTQELSLGTAAAAHLGAVVRTLDYPSDNTGPLLYTQDIVNEPVQYERGYLRVPQGPGLGMEVDEAFVREVSDLDEWTFVTDLTTMLDRTPAHTDAHE